MGLPEENRQCYKKVTVMQEFIVGATYEDKPELLPPERAIFFAVYPKFTNVDIRMTIDVFQGEMDVYVSSSNRAIAVYVNKTTGSHIVKILKPERSRRDTYPSQVRNVHQVRAKREKLNTFVVFSPSYYALVIHSVSNRLVITFPHAEHTLRDTRFYLVFQTRSSIGSGGVLYFRQDLSQIDLFVFFSVFFSVFFLTMSFCVLIWKVKLFLDQRQVHHAESVELEQRRSRPFATYAFLSGNNNQSTSCWRLNSKTRQLHLKDIKERPVISPIAQEPMSDGRAAVLTVMFQMPGNECSEFQLTLGSALTLVSNQHTVSTQPGFQMHSGNKIITRHTHTFTS